MVQFYTISMYKNVIGVRADFHTLLQGLTKHTAHQLDNIEQAEAQDAMYTSRRLMLPMYANVVTYVSDNCLQKVRDEVLIAQHWVISFQVLNYNLRVFGNSTFIKFIN